MKPRILLRHVRCFLAVAETRSFTIAASRLFLSQSSLTATIQQFEEGVGVKLFERTTRHVELTQAGIHFKGEAEKILNTFDASIQDLRAFSHGTQGHIRIAAVPSVVLALLVPAIPLLQESFPDITFAIRDSSATYIEQMLINGDIDFALVTKSTGYQELEYVTLLKDHYGIVCRAPHPLAQDTSPVRWDDLPEQGYVQFTNDTALGILLAAHPSASRLYGKQQDEVSSSTALYAMLGLNGRYSIVGALAADMGLFPDFHYRELIDPVLTREICLATRRLRYLTPDAKRILNSFLEAFEKITLPRSASLIDRPSVNAEWLLNSPGL